MMIKWISAVGVGFVLANNLQPPPTVPPCLAVLGSMVAGLNASDPSAPPTNPKAFAALNSMVMASAQNLPFDAGKWVMCMSMKNDEFPATYHLITANATLGPGFTHVMEYGICLPKQCTKEDVRFFPLVNTPFPKNTPNLQQMEMLRADYGQFSRMFTPLLFTGRITVASCTRAISLGGKAAPCPWNETSLSVSSKSVDDMRKPNLGTWIAIAVVSAMTLLIIASTAISVQAKNRVAPTAEGETGLLEEGAQAPRSKPGLEKNLLISAFSLVGVNGTWDKLWVIPPYKDTDCLNGARVLSMLWVIMGHTFIMSEGIVGFSNPQDVIQSPMNKDAAENNWAFMFILNAQMSVDTFFWMGGFLFSLLTVKDLEKTRGKFMHLQALILRYLRLTPSLAFVMLVYYQIWPYLSSGPFAPRFQTSISRRCDMSWWSELTYTVNFVPFDSDDVCMGWTWYLGDDMIFFIFGILLVPLYYKYRPVGWAVTLFLTGASIGVTLWLCIAHHLSPEALDYHYAAYSYWAYSKPYTRIPVYFVGITSAWILLNMERRGVTKQSGGMVGPIGATLLWWFAVGMTTFITLIPATNMGDSINSWKDWQSTLFLTFSRPVWGACWAVMTFLCYYGHVPLTNAILSHRFWTPFARLTYGAYLCHPLVIKLAGACSVQYYTFSGMDELYRMTGNAIMAYSASFVVWCYIERPMMTFTTAMIKSKKKAKPEEKIAATQEKAQTDETQAINKPVAGK